VKKQFWARALLLVALLSVAVGLASGCGPDPEELVDEGEVDTVFDLLANGSLEERRDAALALSESGDETAVEPLIAALEDDDEFVRALAAKALGEIGDERAIEPLRGALEDNDERVREAAETALDKMEASAGS
jgi:HEAT repeat protein